MCRQRPRTPKCGIEDVVVWYGLVTSRGYSTKDTDVWLDVKGRGITSKGSGEVKGVVKRLCTDVSVQNEMNGMVVHPHVIRGVGWERLW